MVKLLNILFSNSLNFYFFFEWKYWIKEKDICEKWKLTNMGNEFAAVIVKLTTLRDSGPITLS